MAKPSPNHALRISPILVVTSSHATIFVGTIACPLPALKRDWPAHGWHPAAGASILLVRDRTSRQRPPAMPSSTQPTSQSASRREFLRVGLGGFGALSLPALMRLQAEGATAKARESTAVIIVWLRGGCSHLDTYDPKPDAGSEYPGPFATIATKTPGLRLTELLPRQARLSDKFSLLRSDGPHRRRTSGRLAATALGRSRRGRTSSVPVYPDLMSVAHYLRSGQAARLAQLRRRQSDHALRQFHHRRAGLPGAVVRAVRGHRRPQPAELQGAQRRPGRSGRARTACTSASACGSSFDDFRRGDR